MHVLHNSERAKFDVQLCPNQVAKLSAISINLLPSRSTSENFNQIEQKLCTCFELRTSQIAFPTTHITSNFLAIKAFPRITAFHYQQSERNYRVNSVILISCLHVFFSLTFQQIFSADYVQLPRAFRFYSPRALFRFNYLRHHRAQPVFRYNISQCNSGMHNSKYIKCGFRSSGSGRFGVEQKSKHQSSLKII